MIRHSALRPVRGVWMWDRCRIAPRWKYSVSASQANCRNGFSRIVAFSASDEPAQESYRTPPPAIQDIVNIPPEPLYSFSPSRQHILQLDRSPSNPSIAELARPELKLAGIRVDPEGFCRSRQGYFLSLSVAGYHQGLSLPFSIGRPITGIPEGYVISNVSWSPDSSRIAFTLRQNGDEARPPAELWVAATETGEASCLLNGKLNSIFQEYTWVDKDTIVAAVVPNDHPQPPTRPAAPIGPRIEENSPGNKSQTRTYQDLLKDTHDGMLFDYYCSSDLMMVNVATKECVRLSPRSRVYTGVSPSPDGKYILVAWLQPPWSYAVPCGRFPKKVELWDRDGNVVKEVASLPLADDIPLAFDSCRKGPRNIGWRDDKPADLVWVECQDMGDPAIDVSPRDIVYSLSAAAAAADKDAPTRVIAATDMRFAGITWGPDGSLALLIESEWKSRRSKTWMISPDFPEKEPILLFDRNSEDTYKDPGAPLLRRTALGRYVLAHVDSERKLLLQGAGASPIGSFPFLDMFDLDTKETQRIWQCSAPYYEFLTTILNDEPGNRVLSLAGLEMLGQRESIDTPPQYFRVTFTGDGSKPDWQQISHFPHPYPTLQGLTKEVLKYEREDGVELNGTLYLPPGYNKERDDRLPCIVWAYPREFKSRDTAGFAILDGPSMPIIGEGNSEPNDTYIEQLTSSARAAVKKLGDTGCIDVDRIAVAGHSYGAFMAAALLAHEPHLFACGIARSGAYNRTLTPFGFQSEERTFWDAMDTYNKMSPFMAANKIARPLLLIHGEADNNPGTLTMQSERLYAALKGHGAVARLVLLPYESHSYLARESVLHCLAEMYDWLEKHLMN